MMNVQTATDSPNYGALTSRASEPETKLGFSQVVATSVVLLCTATSSQAKSPETISQYEVAPTTFHAEGTSSVRHFFKPITVRERIVNEIRSLALLESGWAGDGSVAPTSEAVNEAEIFSRQIDWELFSKPSISPASDGEINFFWNSEQVYLDLGFSGDGHYSFFARTADGKMLSGDDIPISDPQTSRLISDLIR